MCGIFAYVGENAYKKTFDGLKKLDYRGYDSWGVVSPSGQGLEVYKKVGEMPSRIIKPERKNGVRQALGHTRWATHGSVTKINAHPHLAEDGSFAVVHNGVVENFEILKDNLVKREKKFVSETDTEVIVKLIEEARAEGMDYPSSFRTGLGKLEGRNTVALLTDTGRILAARSGSPLVLGKTSAGEIILSSDTLSFATLAQEVMVMENGQLVDVDKGEVSLYDLKTNHAVPVQFAGVRFEDTSTSKRAYEHYMLKEIHDTPSVLSRLATIEPGLLEGLVRRIKKSRNIYTIGSGTAGAAAGLIAHYFREYASVKALALSGSEADSYLPLLSKDDLVMAVSQSGETADVLRVLEMVKERKVMIASYVNMPGTLMTQMADYSFLTEAGPEKCVLSTKVFTAQAAWGYLVAKAVAGEFDQAVKDITTLAKVQEAYLENQTAQDQLMEAAQLLVAMTNVILLGKGEDVFIANEGMIKLTEAAYIHAHAIPAGDLKHFAITLMEEGLPVIALDSPTQPALMNASISQVKARGAMVIGVGEKAADHFDVWLRVPRLGALQSLMKGVTLQLLAYYTGLALGNPIDKPRNIAKSVTVV
jgi:glutamine---fructose-6-phosphate transaminase (isomerizing)